MKGKTWRSSCSPTLYPITYVRDTAVFPLSLPFWYFLFVSLLLAGFFSFRLTFRCFSAEPPISTRVGHKPLMVQHDAAHCRWHNISGEYCLSQLGSRVEGGEQDQTQFPFSVQRRVLRTALSSLLVGH